jgi:uncharacterized protein (DUF433 family)
MTPGVCGGRPRIDGTRLSVEWLVKQLRAGDSPDDIVEMWPQVTRAALYSALSYYHDHKEEIDASIVEGSVEKMIERGEIDVDIDGVVSFPLPSDDR